MATKKISPRVRTKQRGYPHEREARRSTVLLALNEHRERINGLAKRLADTESNVSGNGQTLSTVADRVRTLAAAIPGGTNQTLADWQKEIDLVKKLVEQLSYDTKRNEVSLGAVHSKINNLSDDKVINKQVIAMINHERAHQQHDLQGVHSRIDAVNGNINQLRSDLDACAENLDDETNSFSAGIDALQDRLNGLTKQIADLEPALKTEIEDRNNDVIGLGKRISGLAERVGVLAKQVELYTNDEGSLGRDKAPAPHRKDASGLEKEDAVINTLADHETWFRTLDKSVMKTATDLRALADRVTAMHTEIDTRLSLHRDTLEQHADRMDQQDITLRDLRKLVRPLAPGAERLAQAGGTEPNLEQSLRRRSETFTGATRDLAFATKWMKPEDFVPDTTTEDMAAMRRVMKEWADAYQLKLDPTWSTRQRLPHLLGMLEARLNPKPETAQASRFPRAEMRKDSDGRDHIFVEVNANDWVDVTQLRLNERDVNQARNTSHAAMFHLLKVAVTYRQDAFDNDAPVNGADLVEFFAEWRRKAQKLVGR